MIGTFTAVAVYVSINVLINVGLAFRVIRLRVKTRTSYGGGDDTALEWAIRAHGNNAEYAAFALASLVLLALLDCPAIIAHLIGSTYTVGRLLVAYAHGWQFGRGKLRQVGMGLTFLSLIGSSIALIVLASELDT